MIDVIVAGVGNSGLDFSADVSGHGTVMSRRPADVAVVHATIEEGSTVAGSRVRDIALPTHTNIAVIVREGSAIFPDGDTPILIGDFFFFKQKTAYEITR